MKNKWGMLGKLGLSLLVGLGVLAGAWAAEMPVGKKVKVHLKSGEVVEGVLKTADQEEIVLQSGETDQSLKFTQIEKIVVAENQLPVPVEQEVAPEKKQPEKKKVKFFGQLEYWSTDDAFEANEQALNEYVDPIASLLSVADKSFNVDSGLGVRAGFLVPTDSSLLIGASLGYISGPKNNLKYYLADSVADFETASQEEETKFIRLLAEARTHFDLSEKVGFRIGAGIGIAKGNIDQTWSYDDSFGPPFSGSASKDWTGFTWEIAPSLLFKAGQTNIEIGVAYAGFPKLDEDEDFNEFEWTPFGLRVGVEF